MHLPLKQYFRIMKFLEIFCILRRLQFFENMPSTCSHVELHSCMTIYESIDYLTKHRKQLAVILSTEQFFNSM